MIPELCPRNRMARQSLRIAFIFGLAACRDSAARTDRSSSVWSDLPERGPTSLRATAGLKVIPVGAFGSDTGAAALGLISAVAATEQVLFVFDCPTCQVVVSARFRRMVYRRYGRCGRGPTDMTFATFMVVSNDTLTSTDRSGAWLSLWSPSGPPLAIRPFTFS